MCGIYLEPFLSIPQMRASLLGASGSSLPCLPYTESKKSQMFSAIVLIALNLQNPCSRGRGSTPKLLLGPPEMSSMAHLVLVSPESNISFPLLSSTTKHISSMPDFSWGFTIAQSTVNQFNVLADPYRGIRVGLSTFWAEVRTMFQDH